jgi:hypothetical protein
MFIVYSLTLAHPCAILKVFAKNYIFFFSPVLNLQVCARTTVGVTRIATGSTNQ